MAITNGYITRNELQYQIDPSGVATFEPADETAMDVFIEAASRWIDSKTDCRFYASTETRYFTPDWSDLIYIDDLISVTTLKTDDNEDGTYETTWTTDDYVLEPRNAATNTTDPKPYRQVRTDVNGDYTFPVGVRYGVEIVGSWGYASSVPDYVKAACLLLSHRLWKRKDAIFGVAGAPAVGVTVVQARIVEDSDVLALLHAVDRRGWYA